MDKSKQAFKARERRLRAKYRRKLRTAVVLCLVIGLGVGFVAGRMTASTSILAAPTPTVTVEPTATPEPTPMPTATVVPSTAPAAINTVIPTAEPTDAATTEPITSAEATDEIAVASAPTSEPTVEPTAEATAEPVAQTTVTVVAEGESQTFPVQAYADGSARNDTQSLPYETLSFQMTVTRLLDNDYYVSNYGSTHRLEEGTAGVEFELMLNNYQGVTVIEPNKLIKNIGIESADGMVTYGYRLTDAEISGSDDITLQTNVPVKLYKRFVQGDAQPVYLVVTVTIDGVDQVYKFELAATEEAEPAVEYDALTKGDSSDAVKALQTHLITRGYLELGEDDGIYGAGTAEAVKKAQTDLGMEADGIASPEFQAAFFAED